MERIREGLVRAYEDGSLLKLWYEHYKESIDFVRLDKRRIYRIKNSSLDGLEEEYQNHL